MNDSKDSGLLRVREHKDSAAVKFPLLTETERDDSKSPSTNLTVSREA